VYLPRMSLPRRLIEVLLVWTGVICVSLTEPAAQASADSDAGIGIVGSWLVEAPDAPFPYHLFVFNADGTMQQANPDTGDPDASDSDGKGVWREQNGRILGKFVEIAADRSTHRFVSIGEISYDIGIASDHLTGTASSKFFDQHRTLLRGPFVTSLEGQRISLP